MPVTGPPVTGILLPSGRAPAAAATPMASAAPPRLPRAMASRCPAIPVVSRRTRCCRDGGIGLRVQVEDPDRAGLGVARGPVVERILKQVGGSSSAAPQPPPNGLGDGPAGGSGTDAAVGESHAWSCSVEWILERRVSTGTGSGCRVGAMCGGPAEYARNGAPSPTRRAQPLTTGADVRPETGTHKHCGTCSTACSDSSTTASGPRPLRRVHRLPTACWDLMGLVETLLAVA
jgi:hypothetical protein